MSTPLGTSDRPLKVAVIGSGPSGFYAIAALFKIEGLHVLADLYDRLPTPYGLVRGGVAPDHQKMKSVIAMYEKTAANPRFRFFGNVTLGQDLSVEELLSAYDAIIYAVGCESDRKLGIAGEALSGVCSATEFVGWYNGHPDFADRRFDLANTTRVAIFGNGNVAADVARVLAHRAEDLVGTDIAGYALEELKRSRVEEILVIGRRGPAQSAFSAKEIEELAKLPHADLTIEPSEVEVDPITTQWLEQGAPATALKNLEVLARIARTPPRGHSRRIAFRFLSSPVEFLGTGGRLSGVRLEAAELYADERGIPRPRGTGDFREEPIQLSFAAIGYHGRPIEGVPFDPSYGTIPNVEGRVATDPEGTTLLPGQYVVGWAKRGPSGLIGTNVPDSRATVLKLLEDLRDRPAEPLSEDHDQQIPRLLTQRGVHFVNLEDWRKIDRHEVEQGRRLGKVREKLSSVEAMLRIVARDSEPRP